MKKSSWKKLISWVILFVLIGFGYNQIKSSLVESMREIPMSEFLDEVEANKISEVKIRQDEIQGKYTTGETFKVRSLNYSGLIDVLRAHNVKFAVLTGETLGFYILNIFVSWIPMFLLIGLWMFFMNRLQAGNARAMGFSRSKAKLYEAENVKTKLDDVGGIKESKEELVEVVEFLKEPARFKALGGKIPRGVLLIGSPGTGKTLLARAIAGEAGVPFFNISGSSFVEMFVGVGASRVRDMFAEAKKRAPCLVFIDEIDAVGRHRGAGIGGGNDEREQTLNQLLVEMDGFDRSEGIIVIAATNRPDVLDSALLRPGRFDRRITIPLPDIEGRKEILDIHVKKSGVPMGLDVDLRVIARGTPGFSGADLANLVNEAALFAARHSQKIVTMVDCNEAKDKILLGVARKSMIITDDEKELTAYHEAGHAVVALMIKGPKDPIYKATIMPRGSALGMVVRLPESDRVSMTREKLKVSLAIAAAGRAAEVIKFGEDRMTSGASSDIEMMTKIANSMVKSWGMSDAAGMLRYSPDEVYLHEPQKICSDCTYELLDNEVKKLIDEAYLEAKNIIKDNGEAFERLAQGLLKYETLTGDEIYRVLKGEELSERDVIIGEDPQTKEKATSTFG